MTKQTKDVVVPKGRVEHLPRLASFTDFDRLFDDFFGRRWMRPFGWERPVAEMAASMPSVDVIDRDDEVVVRAEVPGYKKEEIDVTVANSSLTIKGETKTEEKEEKGDFYRCEITHGAFTRTLALPAEVDDAKAKAVMKDGVLELTLPKREKSRRHAITIA